MKRKDDIMKNTFWNDAARAGAIVALPSIFFTAVGFTVSNPGVLSLVSMVVYFVLVAGFVRRRANSFGDAGYSYGRCVGFTSAVCMCAGFLEGAFSAVAANWLFAEKFAEQLSLTIGMLERTGVYTGEELQMVADMSTSPLMAVVGSMFGAAIRGALLGLIIAAFTKRDPNIFAEKDE